MSGNHDDINVISTGGTSSAADSSVYTGGISTASIYQPITTINGIDINKILDLKKKMDKLDITIDDVLDALEDL